MLRFLEASKINTHSLPGPRGLPPSLPTSHLILLLESFPFPLILCSSRSSRPHASPGPHCPRLEPAACPLALYWPLHAATIAAALALLSLCWLLLTAAIEAASTGQFLGSARGAPTSQGLLIGAQLWPQPLSQLQTMDLLSVPRHASHLPATSGMGTSVGSTGSSLALHHSNSSLATSYQLNHYLLQ